ncbi:MAG: Crp/Fnr family transcriptional regulator [Schleiferiaceae bacterium]|nr:Crp/Fnr family transcriptional regulator [Schleiferiaceae bacterium]
MEHIFSWLNEKLQLSAALKTDIQNIARLKHVGKGEILFEQGKNITDLFYVVSGCMRAFQTDEMGKEHTMSFNTQNYWLCDYKGLYQNSKGSISSDALEDSQILAFNMLDLERLYAKHPDLAAVGRRFLQRHIATLHDRILEQLRLTARERYELFLKKHAPIEQIAANRYIASYLGITQQSLSRLRSI